MRFLLNTLAALLVCALVAGGVWQYRAREQDRARLDEARSAVRQLQRTITVQAGLGKTEVNGRGWPVTIDTAWFDGAPPWNALVSRQRPWVEVAPPEHGDLLHPIVRMTINDDVAAFWYNPGNGILRARVPVTVSDRQATELYNSVNGTSLRSIFEETAPIAPTLETPAVAGASSDESSEDGSRE